MNTHKFFVLVGILSAFLLTAESSFGCGDCKKIEKGAKKAVKKADPKNIAKEVKNGIKGGIDIINGGGDIIADVIKAGGKGLGVILKEGVSGTMKLGETLLEGPAEVINGLGQLTKEGLDSCVDGVDHFLRQVDKHVIKKTNQEIKNATPYVARMTACVATACLSEVRLRELKKEEKEKYQKQLAALKKQYEKAVAAEKEKYYKEYMAELEKFKKELEAQKEFIIVQIGYLNFINALSVNELQKRKDLEFLNQSSLPSISKLFESDPRFAELVLNATPAEYSLGDNSIHYLSMIKEYSKATGMEFQEVMASILEVLPPEALQELSDLSKNLIVPSEDKLGLTIVELAQNQAIIDQLLKQAPQSKK